MYDATIAIVPNRSGTAMNVSDSLRRDAEEQRRHQRCHAERGEEAEAQADRDEQQTLADDQAEHIARSSPERHAHANLLRPLTRGVRDHTIDTDQREEEPEHAQGSSEQRAHVQQEKSVAAIHGLSHRSDVGDGKIGSIERMICCAVGARSSGARRS